MGPLMLSQAPTQENLFREKKKNQMYRMDSGFIKLIIYQNISSLSAACNLSLQWGWG